MPLIEMSIRVGTLKRPDVSFSLNQSTGLYCVFLWLGFMLVGCGSGVPDNTYQEPPPPSVTVTRPVQQEMTLYVEENGVTEAVQRADVRARVNGFLEEIHFEPADFVTKGDVLCIIDPREYEAAVRSAKAAVESTIAAVQVANAQIGVAEVEVTRADLDFKRYTDLFEKGAATKQERDESKAALDAAIANQKATEAAKNAAEAEKAKAEANLSQAELDLSYTQVTAPISGRITKSATKTGNLVQDGTVLASIVDTSKVYANFSVSEREAMRLRESQQAEHGPRKNGEVRYRNYPTFLKREIDPDFRFEGTLNYADEEGIDPATGTLGIRSTFDNSNGEIIPGLFVRVRVPVGKVENAILIPERAVTRDQQGSFVLVVNEQEQVERKSIVTGQQMDGMVHVETGLDGTERVILEGSQRARPGTKVEVSKTTTAVEMSPNTSVVPTSAATSDQESRSESAELKSTD